MITLQQFADDHITPSVLAMVGLPDTPEGREVLDLLVEAALAEPDA